MKRFITLGLLLVVLLTACASPNEPPSTPGSDEVVTVYKPPT